MTFREKLAHVAKDDPDFARSARNWRIASWVFGIAVVVALVFGAVSLKIGVSNSTQITKIESPCLKYGAKSEQCKEAFEQAVLTITHAQACAILRKAGLEIQPCVHARLRQETHRRKERAATDRQQATGGGPDSSQAPTGGDQSGSVQGGVGKGGGKSPGPKGGAPASSPAASSPPSTAAAPATSSPGNSEGNGNSESSKANPVAEGVGGTVQGVGEVVQETGESVNGVVEGVTGKACGLVGAGC